MRLVWQIREKAMRNAMALGASVVLLAAVPAFAQDARFQMEQTEHGIVRLDRQTGELSTCRDEAGKLVCKPVASAGTANQGDIETLRQRIAELEKRVAALEAGAIAPRTEGLPSDEEFERSLGFMERFIRRFMGIIREFEGEETRPGQPDRT